MQAPNVRSCVKLAVPYYVRIKQVGAISVVLQSQEPFPLWCKEGLRY